MCCLQVNVTVAGCTKTTGYIRLGPHMPDIILVKQEVEYQVTGDQVTVSKMSKALHLAPASFSGFF